MPTGDYPFPGGFIGYPNPTMPNRVPFAFDLRPSAPDGAISMTGWGASGSVVGGLPNNFLALGFAAKTPAALGEVMLSSPVFTLEPGALYQVVVPYVNLTAPAGTRPDLNLFDLDTPSAQNIEAAVANAFHVAAAKLRAAGRRNQIVIQGISTTDSLQGFICSGAYVKRIME